MALLSGKDFRLKVETAPDTFTVVGGISTVNDRRSSSTQSVNFFGQANPTTNSTSETWDITATGKFDDDDPGQAALRTARDAGTPITIQVLRDGTNGYAVDVRVAGGGSSADASGPLQDTDFALSPDGDTATEVGTGPI